jgi:hypothetical protein
MGTVNKDNTWSAGENIVASEHNANFDTLYNLVNGNIDNANIKSSAAIANTKLAAPNSYFTICINKTGQYTGSQDPVATFQMPFAATLTEVSATAEDIDLAQADETYTVDLEEAGTTVLSTPIAIVADNTPVVGSIADASIADNAKMEVVLAIGGSSPALDNLTVLLTFKVAHTA